MTTIDTHVTAEPASAGSSGLASIAEWITTTDHKRIGRMYLVASLLALLGVAVVGLLLGIERADPTSNLIDAGAVAQLFSAYRVGLTFSVLVPMLLGLATAVVPLQVGARALAFPRLASAGFFAWLVGTALVVLSIAANGGPGGGDQRMVALFLLAHILLLLGLLAGAASVASTIMTTRAPGMNMRRMPAFAWSALVGTVGLLVALPVLVGTLLYVYVNYRYGREGFGGNTGITGWIGFGFTQPLTFVYALPVFGFLAEIVAVAGRRRLPLRGVAFGGIALVGVGAIGALSQEVFGLPTGLLDLSFGDAAQSILPYGLFNLLPVLGALIVFAVVLPALASGRPRLSAPLVFGIAGALMVLDGVVANAAYLIGDAGLAGTVFEEGAWLAIGYGAVLSALGGVAYWGPKLWGRSMPNMKLIPLALLGLLGATLASAPYYVAGFADQPAGATSFDYSGPQDLWNWLSTAGHALMALTVLTFVGLALRSFTAGPAAGDDPWDANTLEWATSSPAPHANFAEVHTVASAEPLLDLKPATTNRSDA